jgi:hypothetical protein
MENEPALISLRMAPSSRFLPSSFSRASASVRPKKPPAALARNATTAGLPSPSRVARAWWWPWEVRAMASVAEIGGERGGHGEEGGKRGSESSLSARWRSACVACAHVKCALCASSVCGGFWLRPMAYAHSGPLCTSHQHQHHQYQPATNTNTNTSTSCHEHQHQRQHPAPPAPAPAPATSHHHQQTATSVSPSCHPPPPAAPSREHYQW